MTTEPRLPTNAGPVDWAGPDSYFYAVSGLIHAVQLPREASAAQPTPAVVMVHGWGGDEKVMWLFKQTLPAQVAIITPRAPLALDEEESGFIWYKRDEVGRPILTSRPDSVAQLSHFVASLPDLYPIDPARLLLIGFSQGAVMCNALALTRPELICGVASLNGLAPELPDHLAPVSSLAGLPVFIAHGRYDRTVPIQAAREARQTFESLAAEVTYGEYEVGHKMSSQGLRDLKTWVARLFAAK